MFLQFAKFVKIVNRDSYTSAKKAFGYCERMLAAPIQETGIITEIRMLETSELAMLRSHSRSERDPVSGHFEWRVGDSGGSKLMKAYEGISGGHRVFQAHRGEQ